MGHSSFLQTRPDAFPQFTAYRRKNNRGIYLLIVRPDLSGIYRSITKEGKNTIEFSSGGIKMLKEFVL